MQCPAANQQARQWGQGIAIVAFAWSLLVGGRNLRPVYLDIQPGLPPMVARVY